MILPRMATRRMLAVAVVAVMLSAAVLSRRSLILRERGDELAEEALRDLREGRCTDLKSSITPAATALASSPA